MINLFRFHSVWCSACSSLTLFTYLTVLCLVPLSQVAGESCGKKVIYKDVHSTVEMLTSPFYPVDYENNEDCQWVLTAVSPAQIVQIEAVATDIINWDGGDCEDYVAVYDGMDPTKPLLSKWCGSERPVIRSSGGSVLVVFHTDQHLTGKGFALKYYAMDKYSSRCDPEGTVRLEASFNPVFLDLPNYTAGNSRSRGQVTCRYVISSGKDDTSLSLRTEFFSPISCDDGNFTIHDGPGETSPAILSWCYGTEPFEVISTSGPQAFVTFTFRRPDTDWHVLRLRALARSKTTGCSESSITTLRVGALRSIIVFPYTTSIQGSKPCPVRFWAMGSNTTLRLDLVPLQSSIPCGDEGVFIYDGYNSSRSAARWEACLHSTLHSSTHLLLVSPAKLFPSGNKILLRATALGYPCNNQTDWRVADSDKIQTLPSLSNGSTGYPNNGQCRYLLVAPSDMDVVEVEVQGMMVSSRSDTCKGDYISFYNGDSTSALDLGRWCGVPTRRVNFRSTGRKMLVVVTTDEHDNLFEGFSLRYYAIPATGRCSRRTELAANSTKQNLKSPNFPFYYPINSFCEWLLTADEGEIIEVEVMTSDMESDCSDVVLVFDGPKNSADDALGRWCGGETPRFRSTGRQLLLVFTADDRWNTGGFTLQFWAHNTEADKTSENMWGIVGALLSILVVTAIIVVAAVFYLRHRRREQRKL